MRWKFPYWGSLDLQLHVLFLVIQSTSNQQHNISAILKLLLEELVMKY
jgi:hypothetical protein